MVASAAFQLLSLVIAIAAAPDSNAAAVYGSHGSMGSASTTGVGPAQGVGVVLGAGIAIALAVGLLKNRPWARIAVIGFVAFAAFVLILAAFLVNPRDLPLGSRVTVFVIAAWMFAGWYILIDRPTNMRKVAIGAAMVGMLMLIGVIRMTMANASA